MSPKVLLGPMVRAQNFFRDTVVPGYRELACALPKELAPSLIPLLLTGILFSMRELIDALGQGNEFFNLRGFPLKTGKPAKVLEKNMQGRSRFVRIWIDSAVGLGDPVIRIGTSNGSTLASGVRLTSGIANEVGKIPANEELWMSSDVDIRIFVTEEG